MGWLVGSSFTYYCCGWVGGGGVGVGVVRLGAGFVFEVGGWVSNHVWLAVGAIAVAI